MLNTKVKYITFATSNWFKFKLRLTDEFAATGRALNIFNECDIDDPYFQNFILKQKRVNRGFHNYIWKPYLIWQELMKLDKDIHVLVYTDSGNDFGKMGALLEEVVDKKLDEFRAGDFQIMCFDSANCPINCITTTEFKRKYRCRPNFLDVFPHYQTGLVAVKNNDFCRQFAAEWKKMMVEDYPEICEAPFKRSRFLANNGGD